MTSNTNSQKRHSSESICFLVPKKPENKMAALSARGHKKPISLCFLFIEFGGSAQDTYAFLENPPNN